MYTGDELDFAYKYPFSEEAKAVIISIDGKTVDQNHLKIGSARLEAAFNGKLDYKPISYGKLDYMVGYVYARMLVSCMGSRYAIGLFAEAEAKRSAASLRGDTSTNAIKLARELGIDVVESGQEFSIAFTKFLSNMPKGKEYELANLQLSKGTVVLNKKQFIDMMAEAVKKAVEKGLPINGSNIPDAVKVASKSMKVPVVKFTTRLRTGNAIAWIDQLLEIPIPDCRHRTVNLLLAPYLMTIKGMDVEDGVRVISSYIEKCKTVNPHTNITESYIRYQCKYAKSHGMKPMSLVRARSELSAIDFNIIGVDK